MNLPVLYAMFTWLLTIGVLVGIHYHRIELVKKTFNHRIAFIPAAVLGVAHIGWFMYHGVHWAAASTYVVFSYALLFNELLNWVRDKGFGYLGEQISDYKLALKKDKSIFDWVLQKVFYKYTFLFAAWAWLRVAGFLFSTLVMAHFVEGKY